MIQWKTSQQCIQTQNTMQASKSTLNKNTPHTNTHARWTFLPKPLLLLLCAQSYCRLEEVTYSCNMSITSLKQQLQTTEGFQSQKLNSTFNHNNNKQFLSVLSQCWSRGDRKDISPVINQRQLLLVLFHWHDPNWHHTTPPQPFYGPFSGTTRVSRCQKRTSGLYGARED